MTLEIHGLPPLVRTIGWWEGANANEKFVGDYVARIGINTANRPKDARFYYIQFFGEGKEGYQLPLGKVQIPIKKFATGTLLHHSPCFCTYAPVY